MGMKNARFDRSRTGQAAGDARPVNGSERQHDPDEHDIVPARDWTRRQRGRSETPLLVHWIDEKGSVVRLISSSSEDVDAAGA
jgi:hypothetical protein